MSENILAEALEAERIIVYGAHLVALECARWLMQKGKGKNIIGFAVTDMEGNPNELLGLPVKRIDEYENKDEHPVVVIAMPEKYHSITEEYGKRLGFGRFIKISLENMSHIKGLQLIADQMNYPWLPFTLKENKTDGSWLDMAEGSAVRSGCRFEKENKCYCKFPTLFYLDEKEVFSDTLNFNFCESYKKICGKNKNLHMLPVNKRCLSDAGKETDILNIYALFSEWDSAKVKSRQSDKWIHPLQVGSKLAKQRYGSLFDDTGANISEKNRLFAELTGAYWIWKNRNTSEYKGICHYRRHFMISGTEITALKSNNIDVLLTTPRYVPGGIKNMFLAETPVKEMVYQSILLAVKDIYPDDIDDFERYMDSGFYYPNNMVIAKNDIYDAYCKWMFPILFRMSEIDVKTNYGHETDRHIAYAAELLTSYYFVKSRENYNIAVTDYQLLF